MPSVGNLRDNWSYIPEPDFGLRSARSLAERAMPDKWTGSPCVFLDRDGTIIEQHHHLSDPEQVKLLPYVGEALKRLQDLGVKLVVVTNQSVVGRGIVDGEGLNAIHQRMRRLLDAFGVSLDGIFYCPHLPDAGCECRKPRPGLITKAWSELEIDRDSMFVVGDQRSDILLGASVGATSYLVRTGYGRKTEQEVPEIDAQVVDDLMQTAVSVESEIGRRVGRGVCAKLTK